MASSEPQSREPLVQLTRAGMLVRGEPRKLEDLRAQFARQQCIRLPQLIERERAQRLLDAIDGSEFFERVHRSAGSPPPVDWCLRNDKVAGELAFLANDRALLALVEDLAGCPIGAFAGVVYRLEPGRGYDGWHDDFGDHRMIAMSINLSRGAYAGGVLQLREKGSGRVLHEMANTGLGDAILFRIASNLEHRVTEIVGDVARTAFAGWFVSEPSFMAMLKRRARPAA